MSLAELQAYISSLFTPAQQFAFLIIAFCVMAVTQVFKKTYFPFYPLPKAKRVALIWLFAFTSGLFFGVGAYYIGLSKQPFWFWVFTGIVSGFFSIGAFKFLVQIVWFRWILRKKSE